MLGKLKQSRWTLLLSGLTLGAILGAVVMHQFSSPRVQFPTTLLNATATHGGTTMAIATGPIQEGVEGFFVLDFITGDLTCSVLNPRTGQLGGAYKANVVADLGVEQGKQPQYLMVTGAANFRTQGGNIAPAESVVYVADANTGRYVGYWLPWNKTAAQYNFAQASPMVVLGTGSARNIQVE
jgi:expansin (peptidoglycan-binding protein)